jgi:hypothetical protein
MKLRSVLMWFSAWVLLAGLVMRWMGVGPSGWVIAVGAGSLVFLFLLPAMGERSRQPADSPDRRANWTE